MAPANLRRAARRLLEPLSAELADAHEDGLLVASEQRARAETWMTLSDNGDGTWGGRFVVPELHGMLLKAALERLSSPRRHNRTRAGGVVTDPTVGNGLSWTEGLGAAFTELVEHLPEDALGKSPVSMVVHVDEAKLHAQVGAATVGTGVASGGCRISNQEARRLLCGARILPAVMGSESVSLELGRGSRLFTAAQAVALSAVHDSCAAEEI